MSQILSTRWPIILVIGLLLSFAWLASIIVQPTPDVVKQVVAPDEQVTQADKQQEPAIATAVSVHSPVQVPGDGFVTSAACKECHNEQYNSWYSSYHRRMTQVASPDSVIGKFDLQQPVRAYGREFQLSKREDEFWVASDAFATDDRGTRDRQVVLTTGSHHMQIYWYATEAGRELAQLPIAWLKETHSWVPTSALFIAPPGQPLKMGNRRWNEVCIKCHTTNGQPRIDESNPITVDTRVAEFGISCEACHGPGEAHIAANRGTEAKSSTLAQSKDSIVHPAAIDHKRSAQICGQCHGNWLPDEKAGLDRYLREGTCFRAGEDLANSRHVFGVKQTRSQFINDFLAGLPHYIEDRYWGDGMIRVSGGEYNGMANSPCFESGEMSCISCHQMHHAESDNRTTEDWANDQLKVDALGRESCLQCHDQFRSEKAQVAHTHHFVGSSGGECYNCHMPHTSYGLLKAIRSHRISSPTVQESLDFGRPNACNQCHLDKTLAWTADHLTSWYGLKKPANLTPDQQKYSATALWCLTGDAGQRALAAWTLGWSSAQQASRKDWIAALLAQMLADPYEAVRHIAHRSLRTLPGYEGFEFNYVGPEEHRQQAAVRAFRTWQSKKKTSQEDNSTVLLSRDGKLLGAEFSRLNHLRDKREVLLAE